MATEASTLGPSCSNEEEENEIDTDESLTLRIQTANSNGPKLVAVDVVANDSVATLKRAVADTHCTSSSSPYIRLIAAGRLLAPDTAQLHEFSLQSEQVIHAVIVEQQLGGLQAALQEGRRVAQTAASGINERGWAVPRSDQAVDDDDEDDGILYAINNDSGDDLETGTPRRRQQQQMPLGFDRLRVTAGLRRAEISAIRIYFHTQVDRWLAQNPHVTEEIRRQEPQDALRRRRVEEERWMEAQGPASEFRVNLNLQASPSYRGATRLVPAGIGTDRDFVWGFLLGFFVGFLMLVWVWMPTVPHKQKLGILTGYCFHLTLGMVKGGAKVGEDSEYADDVLILSDY